MSLTNITLPGSVIADLYQQTLVQDETWTPSQTAEPDPIAAAVQTVAEQHIPEPVKPPAVKPAPAEKPAEKTPAAQPASYKALGNNKRNISVIVHFPSEVFVPEAELQFLTKMLGACKLNLADVAIVNHATSAVEIEQLKTQLQPRYVLLFGVEPTEILLPINSPSFKEQPYAGTTYLFSPGLSQLNQETDA